MPASKPQAALAKRLVLVLGGARSGKSRHAEGLAASHRGRKVFVATAEAIDDEMRTRIAAHRRRRGDDFETVEAPLDLAGAIAGCAAGFILVDCLTVWLGNLFHHGRDAAAEIERLCGVLRQAPGAVVVVSNEVGLGIVPETALGREFRDAQGLANQAIAGIADEVVFLAAGLPLVLKKKRRRPASGPGAGSRRARRA
jgi:adenosylcobinamide kinase/adenosylcobinamide-phosphate guanylyltransferase